MEPFDDARLEIEYNATDGDAGFQVFADAEEWKQFEIFRPDGRRNDSPIWRRALGLV